MLVLNKIIPKKMSHFYFLYDILLKGRERGSKMLRITEETKKLAQKNNWYMLGSSNVGADTKKRVIRPVVKLVMKQLLI